MPLVAAGDAAPAAAVRVRGGKGAEWYVRAVRRHFDGVAGDAAAAACVSGTGGYAMSVAAAAAHLLQQRGAATVTHTETGAGKRGAELRIFLHRVDCDPHAEVARAWGDVHVALPEPTTRVPRDHFVKACGPAPPGQEKAWKKFCNTLFDSATGLMLPKQKTDLGKHCFGYATLLCSEFHARGEKPADRLHLCSGDASGGAAASVRADLDADWAAVEKTAEGRVSDQAFVAYYAKKHGAKLVPESAPHFDAFLKRLCATVATMTPGAAGMDAHIFRYAGLFAGEFYFAAAVPDGAAPPSCGCGGGPVADVLGVTK